jgi:thioredoxin-related protein
MKKFRYITLSVFITLSSFLFSQKDSASLKQQLVWHTDIMKANDISTVSRKPIFAFFTGSDWCFWCKKIQKDVFSKPEFIEWAAKNVVLLELDFPRGKALPPELAQQNMNLQQTFGVSGYPTIWMFFMNKNADGQRYDIDRVGSLGYPQGAEPGKEELKFLADGNALLDKRKVK